MVGAFVVGLVVLAPAAPLPTPPTPAGIPNADRNQALLFAGKVVELAFRVAAEYARDIEVRVLVEGAIRGMYEAAGRPLPDDMRQAISRAATAADFSELLATARLALANDPALSGARGYVAAANGLGKAADPYSAVTGRRVNSYASIDMDFGIGVELDGATGVRWTVYQTEHGMATGRLPNDGSLGKIKKPAAPAAVPWRITRVVPGSPAQRAGLRPDDLITHLDGTEVTPATADKLFEQFAGGREVVDNLVDATPGSVTWRLTVRRPGKPDPFPVKVTTARYQPETVYGVIRVAEEKWDHLLDRENKVGYVRVGPIEQDTDTRVAAALGGLAEQGCRAVILDLRWCPGGYVEPAERVGALFVPDGTVLGRTDYRQPQIRGDGGPVRAASLGSTKCLDLPLVVLVGSETTGGGEMITCGLQDTGRAVVCGQRTVGRASIQRPIPTGLADLQFRVTIGHSLRADGTTRQKHPDSKPTDPWGIRPTPGLEAPLTPDLTAELRKWADAHALRPGKSNDALPFDDVTKDPQRLAALTYLRKKLDGK